MSDHHYSADDTEHDEAKARDKERRMALAEQELTTIELLYKLAQMTGHDLYDIRQLCLEEGVKVWWARYRANPKYQRWWPQMDRWMDHPEEA